MKVKELIEKLATMNPEATVVSQEYTGACHSIHEVVDVEAYEKDSKIKSWDGDSFTPVVDGKGRCTELVVYIN